MSRDLKSAIKFESAKRRNISFLDDEVRFELPFPYSFKNLAYIDRYWQDKWYTPLQYHDYFELCYIDKGEGWFILEGTMYPAKQGEIFVTRPGEVHYGGSSDDAPFIMYSIGFHLEKRSDLETGFYELGVHRIATDEEGVIKHCFDQIMNEIRNNTSYSNVMAEAVWLKMIVTVLRYYEQQSEERTYDIYRLSPAIKQVLNMIHTDVKYIGKVNKLALAVNMSRTHLDREFKRNIGSTIGDYMRDLWIGRAKHELRHTDQSITAIADKLQYDSLQAFCVFFKRHAHISPQQYRNHTVREIANEENDNNGEKR